jgi:hypothetical protein
LGQTAFLEQALKGGKAPCSLMDSMASHSNR